MLFSATYLRKLAELGVYSLDSLTVLYHMCDGATQLSILVSERKATSCNVLGEVHNQTFRYSNCCMPSCLVARLLIATPFTPMLVPLVRKEIF